MSLEEEFTKISFKSAILPNKPLLNLSFSASHHLKYEPRHDKTNVMRLQPAWIQTSQRIRAV
jgi:hypothetical protein